MNLEGEVYMAYEIYPYVKECFKENEITMIEDIEQIEHKEIRFAHLDAIKDGLLERKEYIREKVFFQEYDRALKLYHDICKESGEVPDERLKRRVYV